MPGQLGSSPPPPGADVVEPRNAKAARIGSPATTSGKAVCFTPWVSTVCCGATNAPTFTGLDQVCPLSWETAISGTLLPSSAPKYTVPSVAMPTEGSQIPALIPATCFTVQLTPLFSETATACKPLQPLLGTSTVPSAGDTLTWPCKPPQSLSVQVGTPAP